MIKFMGKRDHVKRHTDSIVPAKQKVLSLPAKVAAAPSVHPPAAREGTGVLFTTLKDKGFYGRPKFTLKEIEAIESGGAV